MPRVSSMLKSSKVPSYIHNYVNNVISYETVRKGRKIQTYFCTTSNRLAENEKEEKDVLPPEPQDCCMSGCANCVWIKYAEEVAKLVGDGGEVAKAKILEHVKDPNLRAFLMIELKDLFKKKTEK